MKKDEKGMTEQSVCLIEMCKTTRRFSLVNRLCSVQDVPLSKSFECAYLFNVFFFEYISDLMDGRSRATDMLAHLTTVEKITTTTPPSPPSSSSSLSSSSASSSPQRPTTQNKASRKKHTTAVASASKWSKQKGRDEFSSNEDLATCAEGN